MSRVKIYFKGYANKNLQHDYDDYLSYLFYRKVNDLFKGTKFEDFKFYTFSAFKIERRSISVILSSVDEIFLKSLVSAFVMGESIYFNNCKLELEKVEFLDKIPLSNGEASFITISPIFLADCLVIDNLGDILEDILIKNFCEYFNLETCRFYCEFYSRHDHYGTYSEDKGLFKDYYYNIDIVMKGSPELIAFAYDVGLGNNNHHGFGMLDLY